MIVPQIRIEIRGLPSQERLAVCYLLHRALLEACFPVKCNEVSIPYDAIGTTVTYRNALIDRNARIELVTVDAEGEVPVEPRDRDAGPGPSPAHREGEGAGGGRLPGQTGAGDVAVAAPQGQAPAAGDSAAADGANAPGAE